MTALLRSIAAIGRDLRHAVRSLRRTPGFSLVAVAMFALCLGANLTTFAVVDAVLIRPLPFPAPDRLVTVINGFPKAGLPRDGASLTSYYEWRGHIAAFSSIAAFRDASAVVGEASATARQPVLRVTPGFLATLGTPPAIGREFTDAETTPRTDDEAILTDGYWRQRLGGDRGVLGRIIRVDGRPARIVGVLPPGFRFLSSPAKLLLPLSSTEEERGVSSRYVSGTNVVARLASGASLAEAQSQIEAHYAAHAAEFPFAKQIVEAGFRVVVAPLHADHVAPVRPVLLLLQAGAFVLLLIGAVNLVSLLLVRASARARELAIRRSLGASRLDVVRHLATETLVIAAAGGAGALAVAAGGIRLLAVLGAGGLPLGARLAFDGRLALTAFAASIAAGLAISLPVAAVATGGGLTGALQSASRGGTAGPSAQRLRHLFIVAQIALAFVLLVGAGLLAASLARAMAVSPGFEPDHVLTGRILLPPATYPRATARVAFADRLLEALDRQPGVPAAGVINDVPLGGPGENNAMTVVGYRRRPGVSPILHHRYGVTGDYFAAMGVPLREGRFLTSADSHGDTRACVVDEVFARHYWPRGSAIGQRVFEGPTTGRPASEAFTVVGVVGAVRQSGLTDARANGAIYFPYRYNASPGIFVVVRTRQAPASLASTLRRSVRRVDPDLPVDDLRPMAVRVADSLATLRSPAVLAGLFAGLALLLAAMGTYGVLSYAVAQRRREIGVRMALGARPGQIRAQFLAVGLRLLAAGTVLGAGGAWAAGRAMRTLLFGVSAFPPAIVAGAAGLLIAVALAACLLPSERAARLSPTAALSGD